jgi:hypothetical protein
VDNISCCGLVIFYWPRIQPEGATVGNLQTISPGAAFISCWRLARPYRFEQTNSADAVCNPRHAGDGLWLTVPKMCIEYLFLHLTKHDPARSLACGG